MPGPTPPALRYLSAADVEATMPPIEERLLLAERTLRALVADAHQPPKIGVHPRPAASFGHAMPAWLGGPDAAGSDDLLGMKWVVGFPGVTSGGPSINATIVLNDARNGLPRAVIDGGGVTAHRTAAVTGVAIAHWGPARRGRAGAGSGSATPRVAMVGAGVQARSHLPVVAHLLPGATLVVHDRNAERARALVQEARGVPGVGAAVIAASATAAVEGAEVVLTLVSFGPDRQAVPAEAFATAELVVAVDYDMCVPATVAAEAAWFLVDDRGQFLANRAGLVFTGYPDPGATMGEVLLSGDARPSGRVVVSHLGVGLADVVFGDAILRAAERRGLGTPLPR